MLQTSHVLSWVHFGDLHMKTAGAKNHRDFVSLVNVANRYLAGSVDFALLPGDNADDGVAEQYRLVQDIVDQLNIPLHVLPGDHDFKPGNLNAFKNTLGLRELPFADRKAGYCCLFLDIVSAGSGGPDFELDQDQLLWLDGELQKAAQSGETAALFMHSYPADLRQGAEALNALIARYNVVAVDMGHTHYNELANDGRTIFAATRSTGQIEEGAVGFSLMAIDQGVVSWRFKPLVESWPCVLITHPADHRLRNRNSILRSDGTSIEVRAKIWADCGIRRASLRLDDCQPIDMRLVEDESTLWTAKLMDCDPPNAGSSETHRVTITALDARGNVGEDTIEVSFATDRGVVAPDPADGSDQNSIGAWPEREILGTQLGPNRNGKEW